MSSGSFAHDRDHLQGAWGRRNTSGVAIASTIQFENIHHHYDNRITLRGVDLNVEPGKVTCLLGPSGSGKTTLLRLAAGLTRPSAGKIFIDQKLVSGKDVSVPPEERGVGLVFQDYALFPTMTIRENVEFGLTELGSQERKSLSLSLLERVGLAEAGGLYPHNLSGGEQQRVALVRALAPRPGILLMDEPFSGLDARLREDVREKTLGLLRDTRSTVLVVTHDPEEALKISDKIALMRHGKIVQYGSCREMYNRPNCLFSARFFSELNAFEIVEKNGKLDTPFGRISIPEGLRSAAVDVTTTDPQRFVYCVRPNDFIVTVADGQKIKPASGKKRAYVKSRRFVGDGEVLEVHLPGIEKSIYLKTDTEQIGEHISEVLISPKKGREMVFRAE